MVTEKEMEWKRPTPPPLLRKAALAAALAVFALVLALALPCAAFAKEPANVDWDANPGATVCYDNKGTIEYYETLAKALMGVFVSSPDGVAEIYCKPGADVGTLTHGHVADDIVIYGNDAYVSGGERDLEVDTYMYSRETGKQDNVNGEYLEKDISVKVHDLDGIALWGERHTAHAVSATFVGCDNMQRVYVTGVTGDNNFSLESCSFDGAKEGYSKANPGTSIYSNAPGVISVKSTMFNSIGVALNLNNKSAGTQTVSVVDCSFIDCGTKAIAEKLGGEMSTYAAALRIVAGENATSNLTVSDSSITYTGSNENAGNGDVLLGDGRHGASAVQGTTTLAMEKTTAKVAVQEAGYYDAGGSVVEPEKSQFTEVKLTDSVTADGDKHFVVACAHTNTEPVGAVAATCTVPGYTGDIKCLDCGETVALGSEAPALGHTLAAWEHDANLHWKTCSACGEKVDALAHVLEWKVVKEATATEQGERVGTCSTCRFEATELIASLGQPETEKGDTATPGEKNPVVLAKTGDAGTFAVAGLAIIAACSAAVAAAVRRKAQ